MFLLSVVPLQEPDFTPDLSMIEAPVAPRFFHPLKVTLNALCRLSSSTHSRQLLASQQFTGRFERLDAIADDFGDGDERRAEQQAPGAP